MNTTLKFGASLHRHKSGQKKTTAGSSVSFLLAACAISIQPSFVYEGGESTNRHLSAKHI